MPKRQRGTDKDRQRQRRRSIWSRPWVLWGGIGIGVVALIAGVITQSVITSGNITDFRLVAYGGQDKLGGDDILFTQVFDQGKPVVLNFWAGLCPPCREEMPGFQRVSEEFAGEFVLVGVDIGPFVGLGSRADARNLIDTLRITYPTAYAPNGGVVQDYLVQSMPTTIFMTPDQKIFERHSGFLPESQMRAKIQRLIAASSEPS